MKRFFCLILSAVLLLPMFGCQKEVSPDFEKSFELSNQNATSKTKKTYEFLCEGYGKKIISGFQESTWVDGADYELNYIKNVTGKMPVIRGFDFMDDDFDGVVKRAIDWSKRGGIVSICWHCSKNFDLSYENCKNDVVDNWDELLSFGTQANDEFIKKMDKAARALKTLQENDVTVLWRPFHEADGEWFWWGKGGGENFCKLWRMMYDHFTSDLKLNNLIWVLGFSHNGKRLKRWYPGDEYCDIVGADSYEVSENGGEKRLFDALLNVTQNKPIAFHECGLIPDVSELKAVPWLYFLTWHTDSLTKDNSKEHLKEIYNNDYVISLDNLK